MLPVSDAKLLSFLAIRLDARVGSYPPLTHFNRLRVIRLIKFSSVCFCCVASGVNCLYPLTSCSQQIGTFDSIFIRI